MTEDKKAVFERLTNFTEGSEAVKKESGELLARCQDIRAVHHALIQYEINRLKILEGEASPRAVEMEKKLGRNLDVLHRLDIQTELQRIQTPKTAAADAVIQGRVIDERFRGLSGLLVALTDREGNRLEVDEVEADASGYFAFVLTPEQMNKIAAAQKDICLTVLNRKGEVRYRRPLSLKPEAGAKIGEHVVLSAEERMPVPNKAVSPAPAKAAELSRKPAKKK